MGLVVSSWRLLAAKERRKIKELKQKELKQMPKVKLRGALVQRTAPLPDPLCKDINETFLLHGTKPNSAPWADFSLRTIKKAVVTAHEIFTSMQLMLAPVVMKLLG